VGSPLAVERQWVATEKIPRNVKNTKKSAKYFPWDPRFSAKGPFFWGKNSPSLEPGIASCCRCDG
jgi:hypothetical protein